MLGSRRLAEGIQWAVLGYILVLGAGTPGQAQDAQTGQPHKLRIIAFGAHPDDCEIRAGGVAALWAARGHHVKFVSVTNGDIGHWRMSGGALAQRRAAEVAAAAKTLGIESEVLDNHDGELMPTLENRRTIVRLIRQYRADIVLTPRPNDYHPDHRYTAVLVQDAAYMVTVPFFCPDVPHLKVNPAFFYYSDGFQKPSPFRADVAVSIDAVIDRKTAAVAEMESQFVEGGVEGNETKIPKDAADHEARSAQVRAFFAGRFEREANRYRPKLVEFYGEDRGKKVRFAEAFELCEYGRQPSRVELKKLFPFF